jgi:hypothetical protein
MVIKGRASSLSPLKIPGYSNAAACIVLKMVIKA